MIKIAFFFCLFFSTCLFAQDAREVISTEEDETSTEKKIQNYLKHSTASRNAQPDSALFYVNQAMKLAKDLNNDKIDAKLRAHKGGLLVLSERYEEGEQLLLQNIGTSDIDQFTLGITYNNLGNSYNRKEEYERATVNYIKASEVLEKLNDTGTLGKTYGNLGVIQARLKNYDDAIHYMEKAISMASNDGLLKMQLSLNLSAVYFEEEQLEKAISTSLEAVELAKNKNANSVLAIAYSNLCKFYLNKEAYETSISYGLDALNLKQKMNLNTAIVLNNLGYSSLEKGDYSEAQKYLNRALPESMGETKSLIYKNLSRVLQLQGDDKKALEYSNLYIQLRDSLNLMTQQRNVSELIEKYESEKKQQELDLLNTKNELNESKISNQLNYIWGLALMSLLLVLVGFLWYQNQKTRQSLETAKIQHRLLQTQLNPHFIFNALNNIQAFGYASNKEKLSDYVGSFSKLMRSILESSDQDFISIEHDKQTLEEYLYLQKLSAGNIFETKVSIDSDVDPKTLLPPMFTQPFVENAVLHGMKNKKDGMVEITYSMEKDRLLVKIKDNGSGAQADFNNRNKLHRSMGMDIMKDRVANLQKTNNYKCSLDVDSGEWGTTVLLNFPIRYKKLG